MPMKDNNFTETEIVNEAELLQEALGSGAWSMTFDKNGEPTSLKWSQVFRRMIGFKDDNGSWKIIPILCPRIR